MNNVWFQRAKRASLLYRRGGTRLVWDRAVAKVMTKLSTGRGGGSYEQWVASTTLSAAERQRQATDAAAWTTAPSIGILVAVDTDSPALFENTFRSLLSQTNPHWRAYVCPSPNVPAATTKLFSKLVREDSRFKMIHSPNGSWGAALETARKHASEKHLAIVDGGDELACDALFDLAQALRDRPDCDVLYSDEDRKLWPGNSRFGPMLKPDWSPETILGFNYFGRMLVLRAGLLASVGGFTPIWDAAREWDLVLRATRAARDIHHLPKCLYHRHARSADEHEATHAKVSDEHAEVLRRHLLTRGLAADVRVTADGVCRATWPYERKLASIIIPSRDKYELISRCIDGLLNQTDYANKEIIIVDNGSTEPKVLALYDRLTAAKQAKIVKFDQPFNYSAACNAGARAAKGDYLLFLNNDIEVRHADWLEELVRWASLPDVGVVGTKLIYPDGVLQHAGVVVGMHMVGLVFNRTDERDWKLFGSPNHYRNWLAIMGACQLVRRDVFDAVNGFDERYRIANSDVALCLRAARLGYRTVYTPFAELTHHEGRTRGKSNPPEDIEMTAQDLREMGFFRDPYFHPALSPHDSTPTLRPVNTPSPEQALRLQIDQFLAPAAPFEQLDPRDERQMRQLFGNAAIDSLANNGDSAKLDDRAALMRHALAPLREDATLAKRFPQALSRAESGYVEYLRTRSAAVNGHAALETSAIKSLIESRPSGKIRQLLEIREDVRRVFPAATTPMGRRGFTEWLIRHGKVECGITDEEILWFLHEAEGDLPRELAYQYLLTPEVQSRIPLALTEIGWNGLLEWLDRKHGLGRLGELVHPRPQLMSAFDEFRLLVAHGVRGAKRIPRQLNHANAQQLVTDAVSSQDLDKLTSSGWIERLGGELERRGGRTLGMNILAHFSRSFGLQQSAMSYASALERVNLGVARRNVPVSFDGDHPVDMSHLSLEPYDVTMIHVQPEPFFAQCYPRAGLAPRHGVHRVACWYWELEQIPDSWAPLSSMIDEVWAPTRFIHEGLQRVMPVPVMAMLPGVELETFARKSRDQLGLPLDKFLFLFMFDMRSIMERKNPLAVVQAFERAFAGRTDVGLVLKVLGGDARPDHMRNLTKACKRAGVTLLNENMSRHDSYALVDACDCYVSLHRSEGLGLTMAEAMLMGKPVIATGYSGNMDFMTADTALLVEYDRVAIDSEIPPYPRGAIWADPKVEHAAHWMRWVESHRREARELGARAKQYAQSVLSIEAAGRRLERRLLEIDEARRAGVPIAKPHWTARPTSGARGASISGLMQKARIHGPRRGLREVARRVVAAVRRAAA